MSDLSNTPSGEGTWIHRLAASGGSPLFRPWASLNPAEPAAEPEPEPEPEAGEPESSEPNPAAIKAEAFAEGFEQGRRTVELELASERNAIKELAESLQCLWPEPPQALAALLAETVERLVGQIVGEVEIDRTLLVSRAERAAAMIVEEQSPSKMLVHPEDLPLLQGARIPVPIAADSSLPRGSVVLECGTGWVDDGPAVRMEQLKEALNRLGAPE
jgi:flagellar assembly protein FliH